MPGSFDYPSEPIKYRHGPQGYVDYTSYHPWLRDEFVFRCVYCLNREQWGRVTGEYDVEHFSAQAKNPQLGLVYENLLYSCHSCNLLKGQRDIPDPRECLTSASVLVNPDGSIDGLTDDARKLILILGLDSADYRRWRLIWIRNIELASLHDVAQFNRLMGFPDDIPNLDVLRPPDGNARPEGISQSFFERRRRSELPATY